MPETRLKILIADDDKGIQALYNKGLPDDWFEKHIVGNGSDAIELYKSWRPDIIVLDIMMPVMSGYEALKKIREMEKYSKDKSPAIIMATAMSSKNDILDCAKLGIQGYIIKPFKHTEIGGQILSYYRKINPA
ncbi:MAG: response regulator [Nitrospinae bacterium]|nr:response regulator [Nitrospinota bacterium]